MFDLFDIIFQYRSYLSKGLNKICIHYKLDFISTQLKDCSDYY